MVVVVCRVISLICQGYRPRRRQPHRRPGLATPPSVGAIPYSHRIVLA